MESFSRLRVHHLDLALEQAQSDVADDALRRATARRLGLGVEHIHALDVVRRSLDVRRQRPRYSYSVDVSLAPRAAKRLIAQGRAQAAPSSQSVRWVCKTPPTGPAPVVIGAGPAGLLAALTLAQAGVPPIIFERGEAVQERARSVSMLYARGVLNPESNVCFGEGGAGTFSDGKLYTRVGDARVDAVLRTLVDHGARPDILINNRPHLGTDKLVALLTAMRGELRRLGAQVHYNTRVQDLVIVDGEIQGVVLQGGVVVDTRHVVLATGHSARDMWEMLARHHLPLETRPFAMGFRVEHPQPLIDQMRYGRAGETYDLPAADYRLAYNETEAGERRGVYSFCMCPGGVVVTTPTREGALCINGMSHASRKGRFANSALVVSVGLADFARAGFTGTFAGADFQEAIEARAYEAGGGAFVAPASRVTDFLDKRTSTTLGATSYRRGLTAADLGALYPQSVTAALRRALVAFEGNMRGFITEQATLIGVETRTASPIRLPRGDDMQTPGARGLFPAGEGLGYGGGIVSAAVDGMRAAEAVLAEVGASQEAVA